jgi:ribonuclease HI
MGRRRSLQYKIDVLLKEKNRGTWSVDKEVELGKCRAQLDTINSADPRITLFIDGGCVPEEGIYWSVALERNDQLTFWTERGRHRNYNTSNQAEYLALIDALRQLEDHPEFKHHRVFIYSDSQTMVERLNGQTGANCNDVQSLYDRAKHHIKSLDNKGIRVVLQWVPRAAIVKRLNH